MVDSTLEPFKKPPSNAEDVTVFLKAVQDGLFKNQHPDALHAIAPEYLAYYKTSVFDDKIPVGDKGFKRRPEALTSIQTEQLLREQRDALGGESYLKRNHLPIYDIPPDLRKPEKPSVFQSATSPASATRSTANHKSTKRPPELITTYGFRPTSEPDLTPQRPLRADGMESLRFGSSQYTNGHLTRARVKTLVNPDKPQPYVAQENMRDKDGNTMLHRLVLNPTTKPALIQALLKNGADPAISNNKGETAIQLAKNNKRYDLVVAMADFDLHKAVSSNDLAHVSVALMDGARINSVRDGKTVWEKAAGNDAMTELLKGHQEDLHQHLLAAATGGNIQILKEAYEQGTFTLTHNELGAKIYKTAQNNNKTDLLATLDTLAEKEKAVTASAYASHSSRGGTSTAISKKSSKSGDTEPAEKSTLLSWLFGAVAAAAMAFIGGSAMTGPEGIGKVLGGAALAGFVVVMATQFFTKTGFFEEEIPQPYANKKSQNAAGAGQAQSQAVGQAKELQVNAGLPAHLKGNLAKDSGQQQPHV